ncbi:Uncharacterized HTH-type transcriptional regulator y4dJ [Candidatus Sulfopaludibacter sp. SbA4]|nr:Uncharacterized HTH-type transcriptional regulator y4dJ [Candidatus Sulfopaludibacter sp. SbA4]
MQDILKVVGKRIGILRREKGWSQDVFADRSGFHRSYVGAMERGEKNLTVKTLKTVADTFGVRIRDLVSDV